MISVTFLCFVIMSLIGELSSGPTTPIYTESIQTQVRKLKIEVQNLTNQIKQLKEEETKLIKEDVQNLQNQIKQLKEKETKHSDAITALERLRPLKGQFYNLQNKADNIQASVNLVDGALKSFKATQNVTNQELREDMKKLENVKNLEGKLSKFENELNTITKAVKAAFYASITSAVQIERPHQTIIYNNVTTNNGNGYDSTTGIFTVPTSGTYVFSWTAFTYIEEYVRLEIVVGGLVYGGTLSDTQETGDADTETGIIVANVRAGDRVYIRTQPEGHGDGRLYVEFECTSTFSGWQIS